MTQQASTPYPVGQTGLVAVIDEAEPFVREVRLRLDPAAAAGVPAHVTVLYPFLPINRIDATALADLRSLIGARAAFTVRFAQCRRFPETLYLAPDPDEPFRALTAVVAARWPQAPPYGGQFAEVIPHLTVADGHPASVLDEVQGSLVPKLPFDARVTAVSLLVCADGRRWSPYEQFLLRPMASRDH